MTAPTDGLIRLSDPAELIAAIPYLLGFHPTDSVVLLALHGARLGLTLRADLVDTEQAALLAEQMLVPIARQQPTGVALVVIGGEPDPAGEPPHQGVVRATAAALSAAGLPLVHATWAAGTAAGSTWRCYGDPPRGGQVPDTSSTAIAAATVASGAVTFADRAQLEALLAPDDPKRLDHREELLRAADREHPVGDDVVAARWALLGDLHRQARAGDLDLSDEAVTLAASALCDHRVRDRCLEWSLGAGAAAAERLWLALVRATPAPHRAEPAALLALSAYLRGDGALAGIAVDAALRARPAHPLSLLLRTALDAGLPPHVLRTVAADAIAALPPAPSRRSRRRAADGGSAARGGRRAAKRPPRRATRRRRA